jgi:cytochrome c5
MLTPFVPAILLSVASALAQTQFDKDVRPILEKNCGLCHSEQAAAGGLRIAAFANAATLQSDRSGWEKIAAKVASGEMPPKGAPRPSQPEIDAFVKYVESEFDRADRASKPDPGRVTVRRLNRAEYSNTIRDLLGVHFKAGEEFPADDSGYGFDNIGDVLTVSPTLMNIYLSAAERIASRAVGADPLPRAGVFDKKRKVRRRGASGIELKDVIDYDAEYIVRALISGHRGNDGKPVTLVISVDGKPLKTVDVPSAFTLVNRQGGATQRTHEEVRVYLPQGPHTFRAEFINDDAILSKIDVTARLSTNRNIYPENFEIAGPYPVAGTAAARKPFLLCDPGTGGAACAEKILIPLARRAYRRPVSKDEVARLVKVYNRAAASGYNPGQSLQFAITAMLVSPQFLFRIERDPVKPGAVARITDIELASRLSYFLWSSMPDDELLRIAESGKLRQPAVLDAQVKRMLADPKLEALAENFAGQWLEIRSLDAAKPDPKKFPSWNADLREAMRTETTLFFQHVLKENRPITDFLDSNYTFVNEAMARHYGLDGVTGADFRKVDLTDGKRGGVLTQASVLTVSSYPSRTSVVLRGKYLLDNILGAPPAAAPPDVPAIDEAAVGTTKSLRQQMESHRSNAVCASCHARMDVLGFGLENYDAIGRWRAEDGKFPVEPGGTFPNGKSFKTPAEMKSVLRAEVPDFSRCLTEKLLVYGLGRGLEAYDRMAVREIVRNAAASDYRFQTFITGVIHSFPFQHRRAAAATPKTSAPKQEVASK